MLQRSQWKLGHCLQDCSIYFIRRNSILSQSGFSFQSIQFWRTHDHPLNSAGKSFEASLAKELVQPNYWLTKQVCAVREISFYSVYMAISLQRLAFLCVCGFQSIFTQPQVETQEADLSTPAFVSLLKIQGISSCLRCKRFYRARHDSHFKSLTLKQREHKSGIGLTFWWHGIEFST